MKFLHLGDLHLGKSLNEFDLYEDQKFILDRVLELADEEKADAVLIAGDVYDKSLPSEGATKLLDYFLKELASRKVATYIISGNHDSDDRLNFGSSLFCANGIYISSVFDGRLAHYTAEDAEGVVDIYLLPFVKASQVRHYFPEEKIESYTDAVRVILEHTELDSTHRNVLVAHQFVAGDDGDPELGGSEGGTVQTVGTVEKINCHCFDAFDYVALGHIHSAQKIGREEVRYSGSPLKYSLKEAGKGKSVPVVTLTKGKPADIRLVPLHPMRDLRHIKGRLEQLLNKENITAPEDFIYVTLTDEDYVNDAMGIFRQVYPNTIKVDYDNEHTHELDHVDLDEFVENKSFSELIGDFYRMIYGCEMTDEELTVMKDVAREAGVINEAD